MKMRPIIFSAPMVRAILNGRKTQTRRKVHPRIVRMLEGGAGVSAHKEVLAQYSPYGLSGDRLWVKETWRTTRQLDKVKPSALPEGTLISYRADVGLSVSEETWGKWRTSLFMPTWASRIRLEVMGIRIERLAACSNEDAVAEGLTRFAGNIGSLDDMEWGFEEETLQRRHSSPVHAYAEMWERINGKGSWAVNPWVWVLTFRKVELQ